VLLGETAAGEATEGSLREYGEAICAVLEGK
jgi:hypothetical protein